MAFLIEYLAVNAVVAYLLEKSRIRMRVATVAHAVTFTVILVLILLAQRDGFIADSMDFIFGSAACEIFRETLYLGIEGAIAPIMLIELITAILVFVAGLLFTVRVVEYVRLHKSDSSRVRSLRRKKVFTYKADPLVFVNKLYLKNCVMRC